MKQNLRNIICVLFSIVVSAEAWAWGETTSYVLTHADEESLNTISTGETMVLTGPGETLTFQARRQFLAVNYFYVQASTDGGSNWYDLANPSLGTSYATYTYSIGTDVTNIRFVTKTGATLRKYYKDVKVTRATTLSTSTATLDFGTITNRTSETLNAIVDYNNTTYDQQLTGICTDGDFTVTATTMGETGEGMEIPVTFTPTSAGTHTGTVTLTMNGKSVTFNVTGVGQTTYYTKAVASATTGGSAYVSFTSFDAATATSDTQNSGVTTASSGTAVAYYKAVANSRYEFKGWKSSLSDETYVSTDAEFQAPAYTYDSESSSSPTTVTYYAVFEEKPNAITLDPASSTYDVDTYETVTLSRTFLQGYSTIALPFSTTVEDLTGRSSDDDWVAQLGAVTYNQHDGYTLFFEKVTTGKIAALQPYVLHLGEQLVNPSWTNITLSESQVVTITPVKGYSGYADWTMSSNFTVAMDMTGKYGFVNAQGGLMLGASGSTLNAFSAYITPPSGGNGAPRLRVAYVDADGTTTFIDGPNWDATSEPVAIYGIDGTRRQRMGSGLNIVRYADGTTRKVRL